MLRILIDSFLLRCPQCHRGRMFESWFRMRQDCAVCGLLFERASGEITGGMGVNIAVTLVLVMIGSAVVGFSTVPLLPALLGLAALVIVFPIGFYPFSRGLWAGVIYLTGDNQERD